MHFDEVIGEVSEGHGSRMILDLFGKGIRQARETANRHANRKGVLPLISRYCPKRSEGVCLNHREHFGGDFGRLLRNVENIYHPNSTEYAIHFAEHAFAHQEAD